MNYRHIWKASLVIVIAISAIMFAPSFLKIYELSDNLIRILGAADILAVFVLVFSFIKAHMKR